MFAKKLLLIGMLVLGVFSFGGCAERPDDGSTSNTGAVTLTSARLTHQGDSITVSGLVDGVETSFEASEVTVDGVPVDSRVLSLEDPVQCFVCVCRGASCKCIQVQCPKQT